MTDPDESTGKRAAPDAAAVDLQGLASALDRADDGSSWYLVPETGEMVHESDFGEELEEDPDEEGWIYVDPQGSREAYRDMEDFTELVRNASLRRRLEVALQGRGAFRRFKDALDDDDELRTRYFTFADLRSQLRALQWLVNEGLVTAEGGGRSRLLNYRAPRRGLRRGHRDAHRARGCGHHRDAGGPLTAAYDDSLLNS